MRAPSYAVLALASICWLASSGRAAAGTDQIFVDGFDGPKWFIDADGDSFGNPAIYIHAAAQPPGYVANALDCNDSAATIHPGVTDDPDGAFVDTNCDGIDGDINRAIFIATTGLDGPTCGTQVNPCHSPAFAITGLTLQRTQIYVQIGTYNGAFAISANAAFYGGYDATWQRGPVVAGGPNSIFAGSISDMQSHGAQAYAVYVPGAVQALLADIEIDGPGTSATSNGNGANSYAIYADQNSALQLLRDRVVAAAAAAGGAGAPGIDATQDVILAGTVGEPGDQYTVTCDAASHGAGGAASTNSCVNGRSVAAGNGGDGGKMDTNCGVFSLNYDATPGSSGTSAAVVDGAAGQGGAGGSGKTQCGPTQAGGPGAISDGSGGLKGNGSLLVDGQWTADAGSAGSLGDNGGGGGGGGGAGGCDNGTDSYGAGGGGGGAGGCAANGAGTGGGGGGGSFGVFAYKATIEVSGSTLVLGSGGTGGKGGAAGIGQPGGDGGQGGLGVGGASGGNGGAGARGGVGGGGGGGQGGVAFGIYSFNSSITNTGNTFAGGVAGAGGAGGTSSLGAGGGEAGQAGAVGNAGTCATEINC